MTSLRLKAAQDAGHPEWAELPASRADADAARFVHYFTGVECRRGHVAPRFTSDVNCTDCHRARQRARGKNPKHRAWENAYIKTPKVLAYSRAFNVMRDARKKRSVPSWLTPEHIGEIAAMYERAGQLTRETGVKHQVDHIIPVVHSDVCGWHVPWNFQVLTGGENRRKSNSFDGTMDNEGWRA